MSRFWLLLFAALAVASATIAPAGATARPQTSATYGGLGAWVDIFATAAWRDPEAVLSSLRGHGVSTLYLETSNYSQRTDIVDRVHVGRFIDAAHADGLRIVAWYLPSLTRPAVDLRRALAATRFRSRSGQGFDSFALDIEASLVVDVQLRDRRLLELARSLRAHVPAAYPLGAIVPSPVGMQRHPHYWPHFPFADLSGIFDVFLPMAYFSYHANSPSAAYAYTRGVVVAIRRQTRQHPRPIHLIGGVANHVNTATTAAFVRAARDCGVTGISLYAYLQTSAAQWARLPRTLNERLAQRCSG